MTKIEWTNETWNPIIGCQKVSPGCDNCYAEKMARRLVKIKSTFYYSEVLRYEIPPEDSIKFFGWNGSTHLVEKQLDKPFKWKKPRMIFVCSMGDMFHAPFEHIDRVFETIEATPEHTYQILTKRPERALEYFKRCARLNKSIMDGILPEKISDDPRDYIKILPNLWIGVSVENQEQLENRVPVLMYLPAKVRFVSCEPLLGPIDFYMRSDDVYYNFLDGDFSSVDIVIDTKNKIDWVIVGGETGSKARPMHPHWLYWIKTQCDRYNTPFFFKQWGEYIPIGYTAPDKGRMVNLTPNPPEILVKSPMMNMLRVGKKKAGCEIVGKTYKQFPINT